jgi:hypothetical protein
LAARLNAPLGAVLDVVDVAVDVELPLTVVVAVEPVVGDDVPPLDELPQPASASTPTASSSAVGQLLRRWVSIGLSFTVKAPS